MTTAPIPHTRINDESQIEESYEVMQRLGQGSFGKVHQAKHKETGQTWAIKSINKEKAGTSAVKLIEREVSILKRVNHPNIIQLNEVLETPKRIYLVMELCSGGELADSIKEKKFFSEEDTKTVIKRLSSAISYLHKNDIVHRDIKLENILLSENPNDPHDKLHIKVTDFGLSVVKGGVGHDNMMQDFCGTPMYMSPEIIDNKTYSQQCDVWAMGVIMYIMLCGYAPFRSSDEETLYDLIKKGEVVFEDDPWLNISEEAKQCIGRMLKVDPAHRMSAAEVLDHAWMTGQSHDTTKPGNVLEMMKMWGAELKVNGAADKTDDDPDGCTEDCSTEETANTTEEAAKGASSETRKGSGGSGGTARRSSESRTPPNSGTKTGTQARGSRPGAGTTGTTRTGGVGGATRTGVPGGRAAAGTTNRRPVNSNTSKQPPTRKK